VVGRGESGAGVVFLRGPPWWEAMFRGDGRDARPNNEDELCGRRDRAQSDVVLRNVGWGKEESGSVGLTTVIFFFLFFKSYVHCFYGTRNDMHL